MRFIASRLIDRFKTHNKLISDTYNRAIQDSIDIVNIQVDFFLYYEPKIISKPLKENNFKSFVNKDLVESIIGELEKLKKFKMR